MQFAKWDDVLFESLTILDFIDLDTFVPKILLLADNTGVSIKFIDFFIKNVCFGVNLV
jgi:hypothetical protein